MTIHATVLAVLYLRGEDSEDVGPEWQHHTACTWELIPGAQWGRAAAIELVANKVRYPVDTLCPQCAVLIDAALSLGKVDA